VKPYRPKNYRERQTMLFIIESYNSNGTAWFIEAVFDEKTKAEEYLKKLPRKNDCRLIETSLTYPLYIIGIKLPDRRFLYFGDPMGVMEYLCSLDLESPDLVFGESISWSISHKGTDCREEHRHDEVCSVLCLPEPYTNSKQGRRGMGGLDHTHIETSDIRNFRKWIKMGHKNRALNYLPCVDLEDENIRYLKDLYALGSPKLGKKLKSFSLKKLETLIFEYFPGDSYYSLDRQYSVSDYYNECHDLLFYVLESRKEKLDEIFELSDGNIKKLMEVNDKLYQSIKKARDEVKTALRSLTARKEAGDIFIDGYGIDVTITPLILERDKEGNWHMPEDSIYHILSNVDDNNSLSIGKDINDAGVFDQYLSKKKEDNYNNRLDRCRNDIGKYLEPYHINLGMYELYRDSYLSFSDMLKINEYLVDVRVSFQHLLEKKMPGKRE
jgi:hypothetical protein